MKPRPPALNIPDSTLRTGTIGEGPLSPHPAPESPLQASLRTTMATPRAAVELVTVEDQKQLEGKGIPIVLRNFHTGWPVLELRSLKPVSVAGQQNIYTPKQDSDQPYFAGVSSLTQLLDQVEKSSMTKFADGSYRWVYQTLSITIKEFKDRQWAKTASVTLPNGKESKKFGDELGHELTCGKRFFMHREKRIKLIPDHFEPLSPSQKQMEDALIPGVATFKDGNIYVDFGAFLQQVNDPEITAFFENIFKVKEFKQHYSPPRKDSAPFTVTSAPDEKEPAVTKKGIIQLGAGNTSKRDDNAEFKIYAPKWVEVCLAELSRQLFKEGKKSISFDIADADKLIGTHTIQYPPGLTLRDLEILARNESTNTTGQINFKLYGIEGDTPSPLGFTKEIVRSLKDLVRHCVIVGKTKAHHYGGYGFSRIPFLKDKKPDVLICDLPGFQFQHPDNSGRLFFISQDETKPLRKGVLDDVIYRHTVGEEPFTLARVKNHPDRERFIEAKFIDDAPRNPSNIQEKNGAPPVTPVYFDQIAFQKFVAQDFLLALSCVNKTADSEFDFRFLSYGTGTFATGFSRRDLLPENLLAGIKQGLAMFLEKTPVEQRKIKVLSLPFYNRTAKDAELIRQMCDQHDITCSFVRRDALAPSITPLESELLVATTNCSDPHAPMGNEATMNSVNGTIANNIDGLNAFNPVLNHRMGAEYVDLSTYYRKTASASTTAVSRVLTIANGSPTDIMQQFLRDAFVEIDKALKKLAPASGIPAKEQPHEFKSFNDFFKQTCQKEPALPEQNQFTHLLNRFVANNGSLLNSIANACHALRVQYPQAVERVINPVLVELMNSFIDSSPDGILACFNQLIKQPSQKLDKDLKGIKEEWKLRLNNLRVFLPILAASDNSKMQVYIDLAKAINDKLLKGNATDVLTENIQAAINIVTEKSPTLVTTLYYFVNEDGDKIQGDAIHFLVHVATKMGIEVPAAALSRPLAKSAAPASPQPAPADEKKPTDKAASPDAEKPPENVVFNPEQFVQWLKKQKTTMKECYENPIAKNFPHRAKVGLSKLFHHPMGIDRLLNDMQKIFDSKSDAPTQVKMVVDLLINRVNDFFQGNGAIREQSRIGTKNIAIPGEHHAARMSIAILREIEALRAGKQLEETLTKQIRHFSYVDNFALDPILDKHPKLKESLKTKPGDLPAATKKVISTNNGN